MRIILHSKHKQILAGYLTSRIKHCYYEQQSQLKMVYVVTVVHANSPFATDSPHNKQWRIVASFMWSNEYSHFFCRFHKFFLFALGEEMIMTRRPQKQTVRFKTKQKTWKRREKEKEKGKCRLSWMWLIGGEELTLVDYFPALPSLSAVKQQYIIADIFVDVHLTLHVHNKQIEL